MTAKKKDFQKDMNQFLEQAKEKLKRFGEEVGVLARKSEKEIVKASKASRIQLDIVGLGVKKEKLYYDIGKKAASLNAKEPLNIPELDSYWKKLEKINQDSRKKKSDLSVVRKEKK